MSLESFIWRYLYLTRQRIRIGASVERVERERDVGGDGRGRTVEPRPKPPWNCAASHRTEWLMCFELIKANKDRKREYTGALE